MDDVSAWDAVVLTGGGARRLDGVAKHLLLVGGRTVLARVMDATADASRVIVVGPPDATPGVDVFVREQPPGGGPVAALAAGLAEVRADQVVVLAGDLPFLTAPALAQLRAAGDRTRVAMAVDDEGRDQYLLAVWPVAHLRAALPATDAAAGRSLRSLYGTRPVERLTLAGHPPPWWDCDTPAELAQARRWAAKPQVGVPPRSGRRAEWTT